jgi:ABC-type sugar transport system permease subunit
LATINVKPAGRAHKKSRLFLRNNLAGYLFISPWLLGFAVLTAGPALFSLVLSFTSYDYLSPIKWVGAANFVKIFTGKDLYFWNSVVVTFKYVFVRQPVFLLIALVVALLINSIRRGVGLFRTLMYLPAILGGGVAVSVMWRMVFETDGFVNTVLKTIGLPAVKWLSDPNIALWTIILASLPTFGGAMIIFIAGLKGIPESLYESATIDGANGLQKAWYITLPMLTPVIFFNAVMGIINGMQTFTGPFVMTNGGPLKATSFYMINLYDQAFQYHHAGYASALAWILFVIILAFTLLIFKSSSLWVYYEESASASGKAKKGRRK